VTCPVVALSSSVQIVAVDIAVDLGSSLRYLTPKKWRQVKEGQAETKTLVFTRIYMFHPTVVVSVKGLLPTLCMSGAFA
jgi:hypothetical protein